MSIPDLINGLFEVGGGLMQLQNCRRLWRDRRIAGVDWRVFVFFTAWGFWNLFYYPSLGQTLSFAGGIVIVSANALWVAMALKFRRAQ
jgi:hypothetical protein